MPKSYSFILSDGRNIDVTANGTNAALAELRSKHSKSMKDETVIGLDVAKPKFWIKRGPALYPISARAAATFAPIAPR